MRRLRWLILAPGLLMACRFAGGLPPDASVSCNSSAECPTGSSCVVRLKQCVATSGDVDPPALVSASLVPPVARKGTVVVVTLATTEPLLVAPELSLQESELKSRTAAGVGELFTFEHVVQEGETEGPQLVTASVIDGSGNEADLKIDALTIDFTPPQVILPSIQIQPALTRPGETVLVQLAFSETLGALPRLQLGAGPPVEALSLSGPLATFQLPVPQEAHDGVAPLTLAAFADLAGNEAPPVEVGTVRIDSVAPVVTTLQIAGAVSSRSAVAGFNTFTIVAEADAGTGDSLRSMEVRFLGHPIACRDPSAGRRECDVTVDASMPEGSAPAQLLVTDVAGNSAVESTSVRLDFTSPRVAGRLQKTLTADAGNLVPRPEALGEGTMLTVSFAPTEPLAVLPNLTLEGQPLSCSSDGQFFVCTWVHRCASVSDGVHSLRAQFVDAVGNAFDGDPSPGFEVVSDCAPPGAPAVSSPGKVIWHRAPWGASWSHLSVGSRLEVSADALDFDAGVVRLGLPETDGGLRELARGTFVRGTPTQIQLRDGADRPNVLVQAVDLAGNASAPVAVHEGLLTLGLTGADVTSRSAGLYEGDVEENPVDPSGARAWTAPTLNRASLGSHRVTSPLATANHRLIPLGNNRMLSYGGVDYFGYHIGTEVSATWVYEGDTNEWTMVQTPQPIRHLEHQMVPLPDRRALLFGGIFWDEAGAFAGEGWLFDGTSSLWSRVDGTQPPARSEHEMVAFPDGKVLLYGGFATNRYIDDSWVYDLQTNRWTEVGVGVGVAHPPPRSGAKLARLGTSKAVLYGASEAPDDVWEFDVTSNTWTQRALLNPRPPSRGHASVATLSTGDVLVFGGGAGNTPLNDTWLYRSVTHDWVDLTRTVRPTAEVDWQLAVTPTGLVAFGALTGESISHTFVFAQATGEWTEVASPPPGRDRHRIAALNDHELLLYGGQQGTSALGDTWLFDTRTNQWAQKSNNHPNLTDTVVSVWPAGHGDALLFDSAWARFDAAHDWWNLLAPPARYGRGATVAPLPSGNLVDWNFYSEDSALFEADVNEWTTGPGPARSFGQAPFLAPLPSGALALNWSDGSTWTFDESTNAWTELVTGRSPRSLTVDAAPPLMIPLKNGDLLFAGGNSNESWKFDALTHDWRLLSMAPQRVIRSLFLLPSGNVLVLAGQTEFSVTLETWLYTSGTDTWTELPGLTVPARQSYRLARLPSGRVILIGGVDRALRPLNAMLFDEVSTTWTPIGSRQPHAPGTTDLIEVTGGRALSYGIYPDTSDMGDSWLFSELGGAATAWVTVPLAAMGLASSQVTGLAARVSAGADGFTSTGTASNGVDLQLFRTSEVGPLYATCATSTAGAASPRVLQCPSSPFAGGAQVGLRVKPVGSSKGRMVGLTVSNAELDVSYTPAPLGPP